MSGNTRSSHTAQDATEEPARSNPSERGEQSCQALLALSTGSGNIPLAASRREGSAGVPVTREVNPVQGQSNKTVVSDGDTEDAAEEDMHLYDDGEPISLAIGDVEGFPEVRDMYEPREVTTDINLIKEPKLPTRGVRRVHVMTLAARFRQYGYLQTAGLLSVAVLGGDGGFPEKEIVDGRLTCQSYLADGRHRLRCLEEIRKDNEQWEQNCRGLPVSLWYRKDGRPMSQLDILSIGALLNEQTSVVLKPSFSDWVHAAVSSAKYLHHENGGAISDISAISLAQMLQHSQTLGRKGVRQLQRYAQVALKLERGGEPMIQKFMDACGAEQGLALVHFACNKVLEMEADCFDLAVDVIQTWVGSERGGNFEGFRRRFYACVETLYKTAKEFASAKGMSLTDLLAKNVTVAGVQVTLRRTICKQMSRFNSDLQEQSQAKADKTRICRLRERLVSVAGPLPTVDANVNSAAAPPLNHTASNANAHKPKAPAAPAAPATPAAPVAPARRTTRKTAGWRVRNDVDSHYRPRKGIQKKKKGRGSVHVGTVRHEDLLHALQCMETHEVESLVGALGMELVMPSDVEEQDDRYASWEGRQFDDVVSWDLPHGYKDPVPYEGALNPRWCRFGRVLPSRWPKENPIVHPSPWLENLFIPEEHRAHVVVTDVEDQRRNHHIVYWRAAYNVYKRCDPEDLMVVEDPAYDGLGGNDLAWAAAVSADESALQYFGECREKLSSVGYCVLESFLDDARIPSMVGQRCVDKLDGNGEYFVKLLKFMETTFPGEEALRSMKGVHNVWSAIVNNGAQDDEEERRKGRGRFATTNYGVTTAIERNAETAWAVRARALLDMRLGQLLVALRVGDNLKDGHTKMFTPKTGGRWLLTSKGCKRQQLHSDFPSLSRSETMLGTGNPGYFTLTSGEEEVPLWVCPHSHRLVATSANSSLSALRKGITANLVMIPPFSVLVGRGDMLHAGAAFEDSARLLRLIRYHTYFVPENQDLPDAVHLIPKLKPRFKANPGEDTEEEEREVELEEGNNDMEDATGAGEGTDSMEEVVGVRKGN